MLSDTCRPPYTPAKWASQLLVFTWIVWPTLVKLSGQSQAAMALATGTSQGQQEQQGAASDFR
ncbi:hypothetical protein H1235_14650 [Pseudoxanthomonas sp. NC8]|nr:hypothetical protein H1235_14650 [Pseudoxanthomonas sp. NC8]